MARRPGLSRVSFVCPRALREEVRVLARETDRSTSQVIRAALRLYVKSEEARP